jgi:hypothetical protein
VLLMRSVLRRSTLLRVGFTTMLVLPVLLSVLIVSGCDLGNTSGTESGSLTVRVTNTASLDITGQLTVGIYDAGAPGPPDFNGLLGIGVVNFDTTDSVEVLVEGFNGVGPDGVPWVGDPGWSRYDLYVIVEPVAGNQLFDLAGEYANGHPGLVAINGDSVITFRYPDDLRAFE